MPESSPRAVFDRLISGISEGRFADLADLYAEDAVVEQPFAGAPAKRIEGRETIHAHFTGTAGAGLSLTARDIVVHETTDPEVVIAEFVYDITSPSGAGAGANVQVLRVRDGLIQSSRDYHDHIAIAHATGRTPA